MIFGVFADLCRDLFASGHRTKIGFAEHGDEASSKVEGAKRVLHQGHFYLIVAREVSVLGDDSQYVAVDVSHSGDSSGIILVE